MSSWVATWSDGGQALVTRDGLGRMYVAVRRDPFDAWGPPERLVEEEEYVRARNDHPANPRRWT